ncbi:MAG: serine/threonine-protein kinase [Pseudomonadota bacterium]
MSAYHKNALPVGTQLAEYSIESVLGHGGFGITYLAQDTALGAQVAIKEYLPHQFALRDSKTGVVLPNPSREAVRDYHWGLKNFVKEARALAQFKHPHIVRVLRFLEANGTAYMVMEYEKGESLSQQLKHSGPRLDETQLLRVFIPILNGLHAVHEAGLLHLDIKPENIYLRADGSPILIDFGSARQAIIETGHADRVALTHGFAPIEQYPDKGKPGPWTDVYAVGATMYRCVTGKRPDSSMDRYQAQLKYQVDPLQAASQLVKKRYSSNLLDCIDWAMQIQPKERPQSARELQDALMGKRAGRTAGGITGPTGSKPQTINRTVTYPSRPTPKTHSPARKSYILLLIIVVLLLAGVGYWFYARLLIPADRLPGFLQTLSSPDRPAANNRSASDSPPATPDAESSARRIVANPAVQSLPGRDAAFIPPSGQPTTLAHVFKGHTDWVLCLAFSPNSRWLASAGQDRTILVWDTRSGRLAGTLRGQNAVIHAIAFSPDGKQIASAGVDGTVRLWDFASSRQIGGMRGPGGALYSLAFSPDGKHLASGGRDRTVYVWDVARGERVHALEGHGGDINHLVFSPNGRWLISASADKSVRVWDLASGSLHTTLGGHRDRVMAATISDDGKWLATGDSRQTIRLWDATDFSHQRTINEISAAVLSLSLSPDGRWLAVGTSGTSAYLVDTANGTVSRTLLGHAGYIQAVAYAPDGQHLATASRDRTVRFWTAR